jgi:starch-binding outer membrane protein, SusD/RagB family
MLPYMKQIVRGAAIVMLATTSACMNSDEILSVTDPDIINPEDVQSLAGANAVRLGALARLNAAYSGAEGFPLLGGLLTDEWRSGDTFVDRDNIDKRSVIRENSFATTMNRMLHRARVVAAIATQLMTTYNPTAPNWQLAEMYFVMGFAENALAETMCSGIPLASVVAGVAIDGDALTSVEVYARALAHIDSGLAIISPTGAGDTARVRQSLMVTRGRILMNQGNFATAATAVNGVLTTHRHFMFHSLTTNTNQIWSLNSSARRYTMGDGEGTVGMNFVAPADPRVPTCLPGSAACNAIAISATQTRTFDQNTTPVFRSQAIWGQVSNVEIVSGVEARLIEAYAQIMANDPAYLTTLNTLRTTGGVAGLAANLTDPGTQATRLDQLYRERAYWLFGKGHRLGDLRRLMRLHARTEASIWPNGAHHKGGNYGSDVNFPIPQAEDNNASFTTPAANSGRCLDRLP